MDKADRLLRKLALVSMGSGGRAEGLRMVRQWGRLSHINQYPEFCRDTQVDYEPGGAGLSRRTLAGKEELMSEFES